MEETALHCSGLQQKVNPTLNTQLYKDECYL